MADLKSRGSHGQNHSISLRMNHISTRQRTAATPYLLFAVCVIATGGCDREGNEPALQKSIVVKSTDLLSHTSAAHGDQKELLSQLLQSQDATISNAVVGMIPSPFLNSGTALVITANGEQPAYLIWKRHDVQVGKDYSLSFLHSAIEQVQFEVRIQNASGNAAYIFYDKVVGTSEPQMFDCSFTATSPKLRTLIGIPPGKSLVIGHMGEVISTARLQKMYLWTNVKSYGNVEHTTRAIPKLFLGCREYELKLALQKEFDTGDAHIHLIRAIAECNVATALMPRVLPGQNRLHVRYSKGSSIGLSINQSYRRDDKFEELNIWGDQKAPADGATFARAFVSAADISGNPVSGAFFRLQHVESTNVRRHVRAISDQDYEQTVSEFHITSTVPGAKTFPIEMWVGDKFAPTGRHIQIEFNAPQRRIADHFKQSELATSWFEPEPAQSVTQIGTPDNGWHFRLDSTHRGRMLEFDIVSVLSPSLHWRVQGPATDLRIFADFQPDPISLCAIGQFLRGRVKDKPSESFGEWLAVELEQYVSMVMDSAWPEFYGGRETTYSIQALRKGTGWCGRHAVATAGLAIHTGLKSRVQGAANHVIAEVAFENGQAICLDPDLNAMITDQSGRRTGLRTFEDPEATFELSFGADGRTTSRRTQSLISLSYDSIPAYKTEWLDRSSDSHSDSLMLKDGNLLSFDVKPWETLQWISGWKPNQPQRTKRYPHQTTLVKTARIPVAEFFDHDEVHVTDFEKRNGRAYLRGIRPGIVRFRISTPAECDAVWIDAEADGRVTFDARPVFQGPPIVTSWDADYRDSWN